jgi:hypothetical protein
LGKAAEVVERGRTRRSLVAIDEWGRKEDRTIMVVVLLEVRFLPVFLNTATGVF